VTHLFTRGEAQVYQVPESSWLPCAEWVDKIIWQDGVMLGAQGIGGKTINKRPWVGGKPAHVDPALSALYYALSVRAPRWSIEWWVVSTPVSSSVYRHHHAGEVSGILYLRCPESSGDLHVGDAQIELRPGLAVLWPSAVEHGVPAVQGGEGERSALVLNAIVDSAGAPGAGF